MPAIKGPIHNFTSDFELLKDMSVPGRRRAGSIMSGRLVAAITDTPVLGFNPKATTTHNHSSLHMYVQKTNFIRLKRIHPSFGCYAKK